MIGAVKAYAWQLAALGLAGLLLWQTLRLADAEVDAAHAHADLQTERAAADRTAREQSEHLRGLEGTHREELNTSRAQGAADLAGARADADAALAARDRLRNDLAAFITAHRQAAQNRAAAGSCPADTGALDLLAELQRSADDRAGALAAIADDARARGKGCEREHDSARKMIDAARSE
ncbi:DUF2514 family protein [Acidovorax sp. PRC11]|uniref:DUF2514 family protein n=1 Tax=Acidovorax sp. PRC11 TaxID=2962592 RepID=UPI0028828D23|nr:DUF2514 family protein [Acidovorax sp. PRC11]MDT0137290.1 DUF2514 family protein [Acidovorax sp. PRC11]